MHGAQGMDISISELKIFHEVALAGAISKAAVRVGLTQPALSWSIKKLEDQLGVTLFLRSKKGMKLTRAGETFLFKSRELMRRWERLGHMLHEQEHEIRGVYSLGVHATMAAYALPRFCPRLLEDNPAIGLQLTHDLSRRIAEGVIHHKYDFGIVVNPPQHPDLTIVKLYPDHIKFWTAHEPTRVQDPKDANAVIICNPDMQPCEPMLQEAWSKGVITSRRLLYTNDMNVISAMTAAGGGIGLMPASMLDALPENSYRALPGSPVKQDTITLIWRGDAQKSAASALIRESIIAGLQV